MAGRITCEGGPFDGEILSYGDCNDILFMRGPVWGRWFYDIAPKEEWAALRARSKSKNDLPRKTFARYEYLESGELKRLVYESSGQSFAALVESCRPKSNEHRSTDEIVGLLAELIRKAQNNELSPENNIIAAARADFDIETRTRHQHVIIPHHLLPKDLEITADVESAIAELFDKANTLCKAVTTEEYGRVFQILPLPEEVVGKPGPSIVVEQMGPDWFLLYAKNTPDGEDPSPMMNQALIAFLMKRIDSVEVRATMPIVSGGATVAIHVWVDPR